MIIIQDSCFKVKYNEFTKRFRFYTQDLNGNWNRNYKDLPMFKTLKERVFNYIKKRED